MTPTAMSAGERRATAALAGIFSLRMLGLFMVLPVFALYAEQLEGVTPKLVGIAIGIYGLTQALFQIPFGIASDRLGRKPVIAAGLLLFAVGSAVAALSTSIEGVILGRAIQGAGAVAAAVMALAADLTRAEHQTRTMAVIGMTIGLSFMVAMVVGPPLAEWVGVPGIFWITAALALGGVALLYGVVPEPAALRPRGAAAPVPGEFRRVLLDGELLRVNFGIFALHLVLTAGFVVLPTALRDAGLPPADHWRIYLPVMLLGMAVAIPFIVVAEKRRRMKQAIAGAVALLVLAEIGFAGFHVTVTALALLMGIFFIAFNLLEATLPSLIAKLAPLRSKGTAMGIYSSAQFLGAFVGGAAGGWLDGRYGASGVFWFAAAVLLLWLALAATMRQPPYLSTRIIPVGPVDAERAAGLESRLAAVKGVAEAVVNVDHGVAYLKVDSQALDAAALGEFSTASA